MKLSRDTGYSLRIPLYVGVAFISLQLCPYSRSFAETTALQALNASAGNHDKAHNNEKTPAPGDTEAAEFAAEIAKKEKALAEKLALPQQSTADRSSHDSAKIPAEPSNAERTPNPPDTPTSSQTVTKKKNVKLKTHHYRKVAPAKQHSRKKTKKTAITKNKQPLKADIQTVAKGKKLTDEEIKKLMDTSRDFSGTDLSNKNFAGYNFKKANLSRAYLHKTNFEQATLEEANLELADLSHANLKRANLHMANLNGAIMEGADLEGALWTDRQLCGKGSIGECIELFRYQLAHPESINPQSQQQH